MQGKRMNNVTHIQAKPFENEQAYNIYIIGIFTFYFRHRG